MKAKQQGLQCCSSQNLASSMGLLENTTQAMQKEGHTRLWEAHDLWTQMNVSQTTGPREEYSPKQKSQHNPGTGLGSISF